MRVFHYILGQRDANQAPSADSQSQLRAELAQGFAVRRVNRTGSGNVPRSHRSRGAVRRAAALAIMTLLLSACASTYRPWVNQASAFPPPTTQSEPSYWKALGGVDHRQDIYFVVAFSGGGMRAAALAYGILKALRNARFRWDGRETSLLNQVDVLSGVSGGGVTAAYYAAYGKKTFKTFKQQFLLRDFQGELVKAALSPQNSYHLSSPWFGRGNILAEELDHVLFHGMTYGQLGNGRSSPKLLLTATDLSLGASFEFTRDQLRLMCSNIGTVPLAVAVAASSAVPVVFSPITLRNYAGACSSRLPPVPARSPAGLHDPSVVRYLEEQATYHDRLLRPYIHLVDGGLADNLGLRRIVEDIAMAGGLGSALEHSGASGVKKIIFLSVNAQHRNDFAIDRSGDVPTIVAIYRAIAYGFLSRNTRDTYAMFSRAIVRWRKQIQADIDSGRGPFARGAQIYNIQVKLNAYPDPTMRRTLLSMPTRFVLTPQQVDELINAAPVLLAQNSEFKRLLRDLRASFSGPGTAGSARR